MVVHGMRGKADVCLGGVAGFEGVAVAVALPARFVLFAVSLS
jgi:hypothetical protein